MATVLMERPGIELDARIKNAGYTCRSFAKKINVSPSRISQIVSGKRVITMDTAKKIEAFFGGDFGYWLKKQTEYDIYRDKHPVAA